MTLKRLTVGAPPRAKAAGKWGAETSGGLTLDGRGSRPPATPHPTPCHQGAGAAHLNLSLVGLVWMG